VRDGKGQTALVGSLGNALTTTYKPAAGQVMVWVMGWDSSNTATTIYVTKNLNLIGENVDPLGWLTDRNTTKTGPTVIYTQPRPVLVSTVVAYTDASSVPDVLKGQLQGSGKLNDVIVPGNVAGTNQQIDSSSFVVSYRKFNTNVILRNEGPYHSGGGWLRVKTTTLTQIVEKKQQELFTFYVPASQDVNLTFLGSSTQPNAVYIRSNGDVTLGGNITVGNGQSVYIEAVSAAKPTSISTRGDVGILVRKPDGQIPADAATVNVTALALSGAIQLNILGSSGYTRAEARNDIRLTYFSEGGAGSKAFLQKVASSAGTVYVEALNGIFSHASAGNATVVSGNRVELNAGYGAIGTAARALSIQARQGFAAQAGLAGGAAGADKSIYVAQNVANADLVLVKPVNWANPQASVYSQLGSVSITLNGGSLLDGELADTRTATQKAYPAVTAKILADMAAQLAQYEGYWSGVRALQTANISLGGAGTYLSTALEGDGQYLTVTFNSLSQYEAMLKAAVDSGRLVRLAYNNSLNGNLREEVLGKLIALSNDGLSYRFQFAVYDTVSGQFAAPVSMAALGYTAGSQGVLYGPAYGLAGVNERSDENLPISFTLPATGASQVLGSTILRLTLTQAQRAQLAQMLNGSRDAEALAALRQFSYVEIGGQRLLIDQVLPVLDSGGYAWSQSFDTVLITLKAPYVGNLGNNQTSVSLVFGNDAGQFSAGEQSGQTGVLLPPVPEPGSMVSGLSAGDTDVSARVIAMIDAYNAANPMSRIYTGPGSIYDVLTQTGAHSAGSVIERTTTRNTIALVGNALGWQVPDGLSVSEYVAWLNHPANGIVGSEIKLTIDGVEVIRRIQSLDLLRADGSASLGVSRSDNYLSLVLDDSVTLASYYVKDGAGIVLAQSLPPAIVFGLTGLGRGSNDANVGYVLQRGLGAQALQQGSVQIDSRSIVNGTGNLTYYQYTASGAAYTSFVDLGNGFTWDLSTSSLSQAERTQLLHTIKTLLSSNQNLSLTGLGLFIGNDGSGPTGQQLHLYDGGDLRVLTVVDEFGNPLTAQSPDSAWLKGRIVFEGKLYAEKTQLENLDAYRNTNINDADWRQHYTPNLNGMVINAGIRLTEKGFSQQALSSSGAVSLTLSGNDALFQGQRVELSFGRSGQSLVYYIKSVNGRVVTLADSVDNAFLANGKALTLEQLLQSAGASPGAVTVRLLDTSAAGASVASDNVIKLDSLNIVPLLDAQGNVTGYRNLANYDRVYLNGVQAKDGSTVSLQNNVAYYVLIETGNTIRLFASKEQAVLHQQIALLMQTPQGQALAKALFTDAGITPQLLAGFAAADLRGMFTVSTRVFQTQDVLATGGLSEQMLALHGQLQGQDYNPNFLPSILDAAGLAGLLKSIRNQAVYDYVIEQEQAQTAEYHSYWRERMTAVAGASSALSAVGAGSFKLQDRFIVDDGQGGLRALVTGDEIYFRDAVGGLRADTVYYAIVDADGTIRLAATRSDAMLYQTGAGQNDGLLALYPNMGQALTLDFQASDLASARAYTRNYVLKNEAPAQSAEERARYGATYQTGYFFYFTSAALRNIENNLLYPLSPTINEQVFDIESDAEGAPQADRFLNIKAGQDIVLRTSGQGAIGAELGEYTLKLPDLSTVGEQERANIFDSLSETDKALLSRVNASNLAGVYRAVYRYIGPAGTVSLDRGSIDFSDSSLWQAVSPLLSNDEALLLGSTLAAGSELQFLFAENFGLFKNTADVFVYNSKLAATDAQRAQLQANIDAARANKLHIVDIGNGVLDTVWRAVPVPFIARDGASGAALQTGALVSDMRDARYLTVNLTRSLAVQAVSGVVSAYSDTTVGLDSPQGNLRLGEVRGAKGITINAQSGSIIGTGSGALISQGKVSLVAKQDIAGGTRDGNGVYQYDGSKALQLRLQSGHALYVEAGGVARVAQQGAEDLNLALANTQGTAQAGSSYQAQANLRVGQVIAAGNVSLQAGESILNAMTPGQRQFANVSLSELAPQALDALGYAREVVLIAGHAVGQLGSDLSQEGSPLLVDLPSGDAAALLKAQAGSSLNVYGMQSLRLGGVEVMDSQGQRGDARLYALVDIVNGTTAGQAALTAGNAWLGALAGRIGGVGQPLRTDLSGYLMASAQGSIAVSQVGAHRLALAHIESRSRADIRLSSQTDIVNDKVMHAGLSDARTTPVVIGGNLYFQAGGSVGDYRQADVAGASANDALIVAAIGSQSTINVQALGDVALIQMAEGSDAQGAVRTLGLNVGAIQARNVWLAARSDQAGNGGDMVLSADAVLRATAVASLLAGNNLLVAGNGQSSGLIAAGQRINMRVDRDDRGSLGKASTLTVQGRMLAPEISLHGSDTGATTILLSATAEVGGALADNGELTQGRLMDIVAGSGQDDIQIRARLITQQQLTISLAAGENTATLDATEVRGSVNVSSAAGKDTMVVRASQIADRLTIEAGDGDNLVLLDRVTVGGDTAITTGLGADQITVLDSDLTGDLTINAGAGDNTVRVETVTVGGDSAINTGIGADQITVLDSGLTGDLTIRAGDGVKVVLLDTVTVGGDTAITTGIGADQITLLDSGLSGDLTISAGAGDNIVRLETVTVGVDTAITAGIGADQITLLDSSLAGGLTISSGDGDNIVRLDTVTVGADTAITAGIGADQITLLDSSLAGGLTISSGDGDNIVRLDTVTVGADTAITAGIGADQITLLDSGLTGDLTISAGAGDNTVRLDTVTVGADTAITAGIGADQITVLDSSLAGGLTISSGDGDNIVRLDTVTVGADTAITAGIGADQITVLDSGLTGDLTISSGDGDNIVRLETVTVGADTAITAGIGADQITLLDSDLTGDLTINAGAGDNIVRLDTVTVGGDTAITTGIGADQITVLDSGLSGDLTITAGDGDNIVRLETVTVGGDTAMTTGIGDDQITLLHTEGLGSLHITAGDGENTVLLSQTRQQGATTILSGDGQDLITLDRADFFGHLHVEAGAGHDKVWMTQILLGAGATVLGGEGDDYLYLSARSLAGGIAISGGSGNDLIVLDKLPSLTSQQSTAGQVDHVDVDGGAGSNRVIVNLAETLVAIVINVHHSDGQGKDNLAGVNQLTINGTAQDETFLVREHFVAKLTPQGAAYADEVQRVNYDRSSTGGLRLNGVDGGNRFYIDGSSAPLTIDGGLGSDPAKKNEFQIGQLFGSQRLPSNLAAGDEIQTARTTQGYLSRGNAYGMTIYGAQNSVNVFRVYSNAATLSLYGGKRDDAFMVYAFKEEQVQADGKRGYVINGPLNIDGGEGMNTYTVLGTEEDDAFVLTQEGIRGAGLNTSYQNIQRVNLDAREGNDHIYVLSTRSNVITTLIGGSGSNTFDLSGDVERNTIVSGHAGSPGVFDGRQPVVISTQPGALDAQGGGSLALTVNLDPSVLPRPASGQAYVSLTGNMLASALYGSLVQGSGLSQSDSLAAVLQGMRGRGLLLSTDGGQTWHESVVLSFDANGLGNQAWGETQQVLIKLESGAGMGLPVLDLAGRDLALSASLLTTLPGLQDVALPAIVVPIAGSASNGSVNGSGKISTPRATDQPVIRIDPLSGVGYANYPDQPHDVSGIQGGLLIEGGKLDKPDYDSNLRAGVSLPSERDAPLGSRQAGQTPAEPANNRIRVFDDGMLTGQVGMQDQAEQMSGLGQVYSNPLAGNFGRITGLGMTAGLGAAAGSFSLTSEAGVHAYDRGIVFHGVQSVNTLLGQGDDSYTVRHAPAGTVTLVQGGGGNNTLVVAGTTVGGNDRPVLLFGSTSQDDRYYTATAGQRQAGQALQFAQAGKSVLDARGASQGVILYGGAGDALIYGGSGNDLIAGGGGNNVIHAGQGNNIVFGNAGMNIDLSRPMDMRATVDRQSRDALTLVLTPEQAAQAAIGRSADLLAGGSNTITAGDGNNIVFANFGRMVTVEPLNYLRIRGDFIDAAAAGGQARYLSGTGLVALETLDVPASGNNSIAVGSGRNVLLGGLGNDTIRAAGGFNLIAGNAGLALFTAAGRIQSFSSILPSKGGNDSLYNNGAGVMIGGVGNDVLESGVASNAMFGDNGRVSFVNDRFAVIETIDIAFGGNNILLGGTAGNFMLGGLGSALIRGNLNKDVMVGDFAAIYLDPASGRILNLARFGMGSNKPDLITQTMESLFSWPQALLRGAPTVFTATMPASGGAVSDAQAQTETRVNTSAQAPDIVVGHHGKGFSDYASGRRSPHEVFMRTDMGTEAGGSAPSTAQTSAAEPVPATEEAPITEQGPVDEQAAVQEQQAQGQQAAETADPSQATPEQQAALAAGVGILGLSGALGMTGSVVFNSKTHTWEPRVRRKAGPRVTRKLEEAAQAISEDE
ncbi:putative secreted calcium-binding protein, partial [Bordetella avium 197N]